MSNSPKQTPDWHDFDKQHIWHPYTSIIHPDPVYPVASADGVTLHLEDGRELIDGMSSWWTAIHGYNHPALNQAVIDQTKKMAHVMFGGLTHKPAVDLAKRLIDITCDNLQYVFFSDSGSVSVEVAIKMALQYWVAQDSPQKNKLLTVNNGYHGDTFGAMAVCDPTSGMHGMFTHALSEHLFADAPECEVIDGQVKTNIESFYALISQHHEELAAVILEPIVQNAGGMRFYCAEYLQQVRELCDEYDVLLILDEIATGFGRTGTLFAYEQANIEPDILTLGKALTGGYMTLAATLTSKKVAQGISADGKGVLMHGPTFMANPLACSVANASIDTLLNSDWKQAIQQIESQLLNDLAKCKTLESVVDVRVKGAIGVVELKEPVNMPEIQARFVELGVWIRPFNKLVYLMPPYIIGASELSRLTQAIYDVLSTPHIRTKGFIRGCSNI
ncbi:MAG: adenosylmethionine--8-amino-7-oxononanoate transaminase [Thiotrichaceae bacterium]